LLLFCKHIYSQRGGIRLFIRNTSAGLMHAQLLDLSQGSIFREGVGGGIRLFIRNTSAGLMNAQLLDLSHGSIFREGVGRSCPAPTLKYEPYFSIYRANHRITDKEAKASE
jgi:hypothetical protein